MAILDLNFPKATPGFYDDPKSGYRFDFRRKAVTTVRHSLELPGCRVAPMGGACVEHVVGATAEEIVAGKPFASWQ